MTRIPFAHFNYQGGGLLGSAREHDFRNLQHAFASVPEFPALISFNEAKKYRHDGRWALNAAAEALSDELGVAYHGILGSSGHGHDGMPPAFFYDPGRLVLRSWHEPGDPLIGPDQRNVARFAVRASGAVAAARTEFLAITDHWSPWSGSDRLRAAQMVDRYGAQCDLPVILAGDLNATASGPHLPRRDWTQAGRSARSHKAIEILGVDGATLWVSDTAAIDHLIGHWDDDCGHQDHGQRIDGCGFHAVAELAWEDAGRPGPLTATVNRGVDAGGGELIDWILVNDAMKPHVVVDAYQVEVPDTDPHPSDHRLIYAAFDL